MERLTLDIMGSPGIKMEAGCAKTAKLTLDIAGSIRMENTPIQSREAK